MIKVAIVGPESTGKTELSRQLANHFKCNWVREFARGYLENLGRAYSYDDLKIIAQGQTQLEDDALKENKDFVFFDTTLMVIKVWSDFKYNKTNDWILIEYQKRKFDFYLLCDIDLPWQEDPLREHPNNRKELFEIYKNEIRYMKAPFALVTGGGANRLNNAVNLTTHFLKNYGMIKF